MKKAVNSALMRPLAKPVLHVLLLAPLVYLVYSAVTLNLGANPQEAINRFLGDWGLRFLILGLAITPIREYVRLAAVMRFRRTIGLYAFVYVLLHVVSYVVLDQGLNWAAIWEDIVKRTFMTLGMVGLLLLLPLAVTSTNGMIKRLGGPKWRALHKLVYPATVLGAIHYYMMVKAGFDEVLLHAGVLAVLLFLRLPIKSLAAKIFSRPGHSIY